MDTSNLADFLNRNSQAEITGFTGDSLLIDRLKELGLYQGLIIENVGQAPFGGPLLYRFGGTILALRVEEAKCLLVKKV